MLLEILLGLLAAAPLLWYSSRNYSAQTERKLWANALLIAALIYVAFALFGRAWSWLPMEVLGVLLYAIPAFFWRGNIRLGG